MLVYAAYCIYEYKDKYETFLIFARLFAAEYSY